MSKRDYFKILQVSRLATGEEIRRAYRKLAGRYHPEKNPGDDAAEVKIKDLGETYDAVMTEKRA